MEYKVGIAAVEI